MIKFIKKPIGIISIIVILGLAALGYFYFGGEEKLKFDVAIAKQADLIQEVSVTGRVKPAKNVELAFEKGGKISAVYADVGKQVSAGQTLVVLENSEVAAQLAQAEADLAIKQAELRNTKTNLSAITQKQDTLVASAYRTLLSDGLVAEPSDKNNNLTPPVITGSYNGSEGVYKFRVDKKSVTDTDYLLYVFDLEKVKPIEVKETEPTALGTKGLFVDFPDGVEAYFDTTWYVTIPNVKSDVYFSNLNAYQQALRERDRAIEEAESELASQTEGMSIAEAKILQEEAGVKNIQAQLAKTVIRAPISGTVTKQDAKVGQIVSANTPLVSLISASQFEIEANIPEADIAKVKLGNTAKVTLDAYGNDVNFNVKVVAIDPAETIVDGVATYKTTFQFTDKDERIKSGMTANIDISTEKREGVIVIPQRAVVTKNGDKIVRILNSETPKEVKVKTGLRGSDGNIEIIEGINEGDKVIIFFE